MQYIALKPSFHPILQPFLSSTLLEFFSKYLKYTLTAGHQLDFPQLKFPANLRGKLAVKKKTQPEGTRRCGLYP